MTEWTEQKVRRGHTVVSRSQTHSEVIGEPIDLLVIHRHHLHLFLDTLFSCFSLLPLYFVVFARRELFPPSDILPLLLVLLLGLGQIPIRVVDLRADGFLTGEI